MARLVRLKEPDPMLYELWWTLAECGLRPGEALALTSDHIIFDRGVWWFEVGGTKTAASVRRVAVPLVLAERLRTRNGRLFPLDASTAAKKWRMALDRAGLERTNLYQLRKACLTRWIERGMPDDAVKYFAGHTDIAMTKNRYQRITTGRLASALGYAGLSSRYVNPLAGAVK
jgi:integrase